MLRLADLCRYVPTVLAALLLAGCGASSSAPALAPPTSGANAREDGTARFDVDVQSGQVKVTPLDGDATNRAVFTGSTIAFQTSTLVDQPGNSGARMLSVSLTNRYASSIGRDHLRVVLRDLEVGPSATFGIRQQVRITKTNGPSGLRGVTFGPDGRSYAVRVADHRIYRSVEKQLVPWVGRGGSGYVDGAPTVARFNQPTDIYYHAAHQAFYVTDTGNNRIRRIAANGAVTTVAGTGAAGAADDWGNAATLDRPQFIDALPNGSLVVTTADGRVRTVTLFGADPSLPASYHVGTRFTGLATPMGITADPEGILYVAERTAHRIRRIVHQFESAVIVGTGGAGLNDGPGDVARLHSPVGLSWAGGGLVVADSLGHRLRLVSRIGNGSPVLRKSWYVQNIAGSLSDTPGDALGTGDEAQFTTPWGLRARPDGAVMFSSVQNNALLAFELPAGWMTSGVGPNEDGEEVRLANASGYFGPRDGLVPFITYPLAAGGLAPGATTEPAEWWFDVPAGVRSFSFVATVEAATAGQIRPDISSSTESPRNHVQTVIPVNAMAGLTQIDGPADQATVGQSLTALAFDPDGALYLADGSAVRRYDPATNVITTIAGHPEPGHTFSGVRGITTPSLGIVFVADLYGNAIHLVRHTGGSMADAANWTTQRIVGTGTPGVPTGIANSPIYGPRGLKSIDGRNLWFVDRGHRLCLATFSGGDLGDPANWRTSVIAGDSSSLAGTAGYETSPIRFNQPADVAIAPSGKVYVADFGNSVIRGFTFDGQAPTSDARAVNRPTGVAVDGAGNIYAQTWTQGLKRLGHASLNLDVNIVPPAPTAADGFGNAATMVTRPQTAPDGIALSPAGDLWFIDRTGLRRVSRVITSTAH